MATTYTEPSVTVSETVGRNISTILAAPTTVCLVGRATGYIEGADQITLQDGDHDDDPLTADAPVATTLSGIPSDATLNSVSEVRDAFTGVVYVAGTDYTVSTGAKTIIRVSTGAIDDGTVVRVKYNYTPADYFDAQRLDSLNAIEQRYGSAWTADGLGIGSPVSHAAHLAFENGAPFVVIQPLYVESGSARVQPSAAQAAQAATWQTTLQSLRDYEDINVIVPVVGQYDDPANVADISSGTVLSIFTAVQNHIWFMRLEEQFILGIFGEDSSNGVAVSSTSLINHATSLQGQFGGDVNEHIVLLSPTKFVRSTAAANNTMYVGGQYAAAALAGRLAGTRVQESLQRKSLAGFVQIPGRHLKADKNIEAANGICVIEQRGARIIVRHGLTLNNTSTAYREISIVRSRHYMIESLYNTFDEGVLGEVTADEDAPILVSSTVIATLERLKSLGVIASYRNVDARLLTGDPTTVEVRFSYSPFFPLNYVNIVFSLDLTNTTAQLTDVIPGAV